MPTAPYSRTTTKAGTQKFQPAVGSPSGDTLSIVGSKETVRISNDAGRGFDNAFLMKRTILSGSDHTGFWHDSSGGVTTVEAYPSRMYDSSTYELPSGGESIGILGARMLANSNPTRAEYSLPVFIKELRDIPGMLEHIGSILLIGRKRKPRFPLDAGKEIASINLAIQFGWAPLLSDLKTMFTIPDLVAKRQKEFDRLYSGSGLKRRMGLGGSSVSNAWNTTHRGYASGSISLKGSITTEQWGTVRWKPTPAGPNSPLRKPTPPEIKRYIIGMTVDNVAQGVWDALPWSWFIDYFTNIGDLIVANQGKTVCTHTRPNIMTHRVERDAHEASFTPRGVVPGEGYVTSAGSYVAESKARDIASSTISASFPIFSGRQLSILGSLAAMRVR